MMGLALITVVSLLLMWRRVRRRGCFGRKASAVLRSVYPLVLGLGGWFIGVALVGAWLGFQAPAGLLAVITTIVGAAVGANLTLLVLDIGRDRSVAELAEAPQPALTT